jgi:hypothetical protein
MKHLLLMLLGLSGALCGQLLGRLPFWLFFRHSAWLTQEEFRAAFPEKEWVGRATSGLLLLGFFLFAPLFFTTDMTRDINWFFLPLVFCCWMCMLAAAPELLAKVSILVPLGKSERRPVLFTVGPNAFWAGVLRLALTAVIVAVFMWSREGPAVLAP